MKRAGTSSRRGAVLEIATGVTLLVITCVGIYEHYNNTRIEKEALEQTRKMAQEAESRLPHYTGVHERVTESAKAQEREFRLRAGERTMEIIGGAVAGRAGDLIQFYEMAEEPVREYVHALFGGRDPNAVELERLEARARAMQRLIREPLAPEGLQANSRLIAEMLRHHDEVSAFLGREESREFVRTQYPEMRDLSDDELLVKYLQPRLESEVDRAGRGYRNVERMLQDAGAEITPALVNAIVADAIREDKAGRADFFEAIEAGVKKSTALVQLDGTYSGSMSGSAQGNCTVDISGTSVGIKLTGSGSNREGPFRANVSGTGRVDRETGRFSGSLYGTVSNRHGTFEVSGNFSGTASHNSATGQWRAASREVPASGTFSASK